MPGSYRRIIIAIVGGLVLFAIGAGAERAAIWTDSPHGYPKYRETAQEAQQRFPTLSYQDALKAAKEQQPCSNPQGHDASDLCAQWRAADANERASRWGWWQLILSAIGIAGLIATIMQGRTALEKAREANNLARVSSERQLRAYVGILTFQVHSIRPGHWPYFGAQYKNAGQTPAKDLICRCYLKFTTEAPNKVRFKKMTPPTASKLVLNPGVDGWGELKLKDPLSTNEYLALRSGQATFVFAGYIVYRDVFGARHFTMFRHFLLPETIEENGYAKVGGDIRGNYAS